MDIPGDPYGPVSSKLFRKRRGRVWEYLFNITNLWGLSSHGKEYMIKSLQKKEFFGA
jgi:hypothetical protein